MGRRHRLVAMILGMALPCMPLTTAMAAAPAATPQASAPLPFKTEYAFTATVKVDAPIIIGQGGEGLRRYVPITGGQVDGPLLKARILNASGDWQVVRPDDVLALEARYVLETADGVKISVINRGYRHGPAEVIARMGRGEAVAPTEYYFRTFAQFDAPRGSKYDWLNRTLFVATAERQTDLVIVHFYRVL
jgi:Protein of unknown function (DUF3237)